MFLKKISDKVKKKAYLAFIACPPTMNTKEKIAKRNIEPNLRVPVAETCMTFKTKANAFIEAIVFNHFFSIATCQLLSILFQFMDKWRFNSSISLLSDNKTCQPCSSISSKVISSLSFYLNVELQALNDEIPLLAQLTKSVRCPRKLEHVSPVDFHLQGPEEGRTFQIQIIKKGKFHELLQKLQCSILCILQIYII